MKDNFNLIICGVGGQGIITLLSIIDEAAFLEGLDVKSSELHGLSQRGGSVQAHVRFGKKIDSPLVCDGQADLILAMEMTEALRVLPKASKNASFLVNDYYLPFAGSLLKKDEVAAGFAGLRNPTHIVQASHECKEKFQNDILATTYVLGQAVSKKLLPLKAEAVIKAIGNVVPEKYKQMNINAFKLGEQGA